MAITKTVQCQKQENCHDLKKKKTPIFRTVKNPHIRTAVLGIQANTVLIYRVITAKSA